MKNAIAAYGVLTLTLLGLSAQADIPAFKLDMTRNGVTDTQLVYQFWSGEYPEPVIDVNSRNKGLTTIQGYTSLRQPVDKVSCTIKNGLYHPWSRQKNSADSYISVIANMRLTAQKTVNLEDLNFDNTLTVTPGDVVEEVLYTSEGYCQGRVQTAQGLKYVHFMCDLIDDKKSFSLETSREMHEQWLKLKCAEGHSVYVLDEDLLKQRGVLRGEITDFGSVGPAKPVAVKAAAPKAVVAPAAAPVVTAKPVETKSAAPAQIAVAPSAQKAVAPSAQKAVAPVVQKAEEKTVSKTVTLPAPITKPTLRPPYTKTVINKAVTQSLAKKPAQTSTNQQLEKNIPVLRPTAVEIKIDHEKLMRDSTKTFTF